jgi:Putative adhesin
MPTFDTPHPIDLAVELPYGRLEVVASDRTDTVVTVSPTNPSSASDRRGAEQTRVEFTGQRLVVEGPRPRFSIVGPGESIDVLIEVPTGSRLTADIGGRVTTTGRLGATRVKGALGGVLIDTTADLWVRSGHGSLEVTAADGSAELTADHGQIRVGSIGGDAILKSSHGSVEVGEAGGDLDAKLSYGELEIARACGGVTAKTAYGSIRIGQVSAGSIRLESGYGQIDVGVPTGVAVWLDAASREGRVRNELDSDVAPAASEDSVVVRARTTYGDITIHRSKKGPTS